MDWIYLSPHYDDAVLSCGGMIWEQTQAGKQVEVWNLFSAAPPAGAPLSDYARALHERWQTGPEAVTSRRAEDRVAIATLAASVRYFPFTDCIYRRLPGGEPLVSGDEDLFNSPLREPELVDQLASLMAASLPAGARLVAPFGVGGHIDHRIARRAAEQLGCELRYYADYPYAAQAAFNLAEWLPGPGCSEERHPLSPGGLAAWQAAVAGYQSQLSTFWKDLDQMRSELAAFLASGGGDRLWVCPPPGGN